MAGIERKPDAALIARLCANGARYGFFRAVHLIHRLMSDSVPSGELGPLAREPIRFRHDHRLIFSAGDISEIALRTTRGAVQPAMQQVELTSTFLGLTGSVSPLATPILEEVIRAEENDETSLRAFYDLFHHRLLGLFFRAWKKYRFAEGYRLGGRDVATRRLMTFVGIDPAHPSADRGLPPLAQLALSPLVSTRIRSARVLELVLRAALARVGLTPRVRVEPFVERRVRIAPEQRVKLGVANTTLGVDMTIGGRVFDRAGRFRVHIGPVDYPTYESLMPGGKNYPLVRRVVGHFTHGHLEGELDVTVDDGAPRGFRLSDSRAALLGVTTQLGGTPRAQPSAAGPASARGGKAALRMRVILSEYAEDAKPAPVHE